MAPYSRLLLRPEEHGQQDFPDDRAPQQFAQKREIAVSIAPPPPFAQAISGRGRWGLAGIELGARRGLNLPHFWTFCREHANLLLDATAAHGTLAGSWDTSAKSPGTCHRC